MRVPNEIFDFLDNLNEGVYITDLKRVVLHMNSRAEELTGYTNIEAVGLACRADMLCHVDENGKKLCATTACPLNAAIYNGIKTTDMYVHHKRGYRIPVYVKTGVIKDVTGEATSAYQIFGEKDNVIKLKERVDDLFRKSLIDSLTNIGNRLSLEQFGEKKMNELNNISKPFGVLFMDIDFFKKVNDDFGHVVGDEVLLMVAQTASVVVRGNDFVGRWGGEEFLVFVDVADQESLFIVAEKIRNQVASSFIKKAVNSIQVTVSIGGAMAKKGMSLSEIIEKADQYMYQSKSNGRNKVTIEGYLKPIIQ